ncbi:MAG: TIGR00730 family Rossman fold protein [Actinomycetota bacterium]|nr:TIGR00730 family Rossman fold protein [Actinomycetota bacterium]
MIVPVRSVCVYCGSNPGGRPEYAQGAVELARAIVGRGARVVYGGARVGMMGALADAALDAGGEVVGVIPDHLVGAEVAHGGLSELHVVRSMHERKALMAELSDGFVAPPGGIGTLEEFAEVATWSKLGIHAKPTGLLNVLGYYDRLLGFLDHAVSERFLRDEHRRMVISEPRPDALLDAMDRWVPPTGARWLDSDGRAYDPGRP